MLTHYTITSVGIFSILFSTHFLRCSKRTKKQNSCWKTNIAEQYLTKLSPKKKRNTWYSCLLLSYKVPKGYSAYSHGWEKKDILPLSWYQFHFNLNSENAFEAKRAYYDTSTQPAELYPIWIKVSGLFSFVYTWDTGPLITWKWRDSWYILSTFQKGFVVLWSIEVIPFLYKYTIEVMFMGKKMCFMQRKINYISIIITLEGIEKMRTKKCTIMPNITGYVLFFSAQQIGFVIFGRKYNYYLETWDQDFLSLWIEADCRPDKIALRDEKFFRSLHSYKT